MGTLMLPITAIAGQLTAIDLQ